MQDALREAKKAATITPIQIQRFPGKLHEFRSPQDERKQTFWGSNSGACDVNHRRRRLAKQQVPEPGNKYITSVREMFHHGGTCHGCSNWKSFKAKQLTHQTKIRHGPVLHTTKFHLQQHNQKAGDGMLRHAGVCVRECLKQASHCELPRLVANSTNTCEEITERDLQLSARRMTRFVVFARTDQTNENRRYKCTQPGADELQQVPSGYYSPRRGSDSNALCHCLCLCIRQRMSHWGRC
mmetsp:Transcript_34648/g.83687  ORF Transcript_34648/g.83687 Transcript_34648/m.83687 type:complete len:239 (+) Transcript_34648:646-1362(+)